MEPRKHLELLLVGGVKHRPKLMAVRKHATKKRGRPRKAEKPHKFTTPLPTKRTRAPSQYVTTPSLKLIPTRLKGARRSLKQRLRRLPS